MLNKIPYLLVGLILLGAMGTAFTQDINVANDAGSFLGGAYEYDIPASATTYITEALWIGSTDSVSVQIIGNVSPTVTGGAISGMTSTEVLYTNFLNPSLSYYTAQAAPATVGGTTANANFGANAFLRTFETGGSRVLHVRVSKSAVADGTAKLIIGGEGVRPLSEITQ